MKERAFRLIAANLIIVCTLASALGITVYSLASTPQSNTETGGAVYSGDADCGAVSLMINVYEGAQYAKAMSDLLKERGFSTTFFVGGKWVENNGDTLIKLAADGMEIGNHGYLHRDHAALNYSRNRDEILVTEKLIDITLKDVPNYNNCNLFAPPSGSFGKIACTVCDDLNYTLVMWTRDTIDWRDHDSDLIFNRAVKDMKAGDLILMHPTECTVAALPRILDEIQAQGLRVDKVSVVIA